MVIVAFQSRNLLVKGFYTEECLFTLLNLRPFSPVQAGCCGSRGRVGLDVLVHVVSANVLQLGEVGVEVLLAAANHTWKNYICEQS